MSEYRRTLKYRAVRHALQSARDRALLFSNILLLHRRGARVAPAAARPGAAEPVQGAALLLLGAQLLGEQRAAQLAVRVAAHKGHGQRVVQAAVDQILRRRLEERVEGAAVACAV